MHRSFIAVGISAIALIAAACAPTGGGDATPAPTPAETPADTPVEAACATSSDAAAVEALIQDFSFDPNPVEAKTGEVIVWTNRDGAPHTVTLDDGSCKTGNVSAGGGTGGLVFAEPGEYPFFCSIHPSMKGTIVISN